MQSSDDDVTDPRLREECLERIPGATSDVLLVGVVHDHPASTYRIRTVLDREAPATLALELPPLAVPLFEQHAADERTPPPFGGEMSAAIQAADAARVVGIDGPTPTFLRHLVGCLYRERATLSAVCDTVRALRSATREAATCRVAAAVAARTGLRVAVDAPATYDVGSDDEPDRQATDERERIRAANSMLSAFEPPTAAAVRTAARERHMAERLASLRTAGDVVAVVGMAHLEGVRECLVDAE
ncbi:hypothetical protein KTS45_07710 [Halomicroarcula limicola]|uniref:TraB/GumN family protein n=1 Tax=Haloarcula limicola TaxID=1429915 RepID=A0A8J8C4G6_9EURY|nr:hypothetical protein [Halomicroarcula limicola]MBV0924089.1 hypothetical protein [Halomicroarcula limicola]